MLERRDVPGFAGYQVDDEGNVYAKRGGSLLKQRNSFGYKRVTLYSEPGKPKSILVHRIVAMAFLPNPDSLPQVNHKNENRADNRVENLEWCTASYNINYGSRNATVSQKLCVDKTEKFGRKVEQVNPATKEVVAVWPSLRSIEHALGYAHSNIQSCCEGRRRTRGGFEWRYAS